jgi:hypothetical protein
MFTSLKAAQWNEARKIKPAYFSDLKKYPKATPLFITVDWRCLNYIRSRHGICLFCKKTNDFAMYDLSFFYKREAWVLYLSPHDHNFAMQLAHGVQLAAATTIKVILFNIQLLGRN